MPYMNENQIMGLGAVHVYGEIDVSDYAKKEYVDNAIGALEDDVAYLNTHAATKQYVDDAIASSGGTGGSSSEDVIDKIIDPDNNPLSVTEDSVLDIPMEVGGLSTNSGELFERDDAIRSDDFIFVTPNETIQFASNLPVGGDAKIRVCCYGEDKTFIETAYPRLQTDFYIESDWHYIKFYRSDTGDGQVTMSLIRKGGVEKAEFKKIYFADHGYEIYGANIDDETMHKLSIEASGKDGNGYNIVEVRAPKNNPYESTICLKNSGDGARQFVDISSMVYDADKPTTEIVCQTRGGYKLPEFSIRYNDGSEAGRVKKFTVHPDAIPIELTAQGLKVRKNNTFDNNETEEDYVVVNLAEAAESINYIAENIENKADKSEIPTKVSQLINDSGYSTEPYVDYQVAKIEENLSSEIAVERARINTFTALENGSTTGDAELQDIRVGADGTVYESAGDAVRAQINQINDVVFYDEIEKDITDTLTIENGYYYNKVFQKASQNGLACTNIIPVKSGDKFKITAKYGYYAVLVAEFDTSNTMISYTGQVDGQEIGVTDYEYTVPSGVSGIVVNTRDTRYYPIKVIKIAKENVKNRIETLEDLSELSLVATNQVVDKSEWTATGGALTFEGDTAIVTPDKSANRVGVNAKFGDYKNGDTLFFKANIKAPFGVGGTEQQNKPDVIIWVNASTGLKYVTQCNLPNIEQNDYYGNIAFDCDVNVNPLLCSVQYNNVNVIPTNAKIEVKDIVVVNLTKVFGAGNEPTAEEFYSLLNCFENKYFEGEKNLFSASANLRRIYNDYKSTLLTEDITVTVGANGDFETLNGAISYLSSFYPVYKKGGIKCYIKILEGTVINEQIFANQIDLQYITIIAEGNTETINIDGTSYTMNIVDVNATGFKHTANAHDARGNYPFIAGENAAKLPTIGCVFRLMPETVEDGKTVCGMLCNRGSEGVVLAASGFDGFNDGVIANNESSITIREGISRNMTRWGVHARHNGEVSARSCVCTNCGIGACADRVADCDVREAVLNGSKVAIECNNISRVNANGCHAQNCGTTDGYVVMISGGGFANCGSLDSSGYVGTLYNTATNTLSSSGIIFV